MNTLVRSALFPLIVVTLLVYLASQTVLGGGDGATTKVFYSRVVQTVLNDPGSIESVALERNGGVTLKRVDGSTWKATNPSQDSQLALERMLIAREIPYDWKDTGASGWWSLMTSLLPIVLVIALAVFLNSRKDERVRMPDRGIA